MHVCYGFSQQSAFTVNTEKPACQYNYHSVLGGWSRGIVLYMVHPFHCDVKTFLVIQGVPANRSNLTVCTDQIFDPAHVFGEAHILKSEHVVHKPVGGQSLPIHRGLCGAEVALFPHGW